VSLGAFLGLFDGEAPTSPSPSREGRIATTIKRIERVVVKTRRQKKAPAKLPASERGVVGAAKKIGPHTSIPEEVLVGIAEQETQFGKNFGKAGRALNRARSIKEQALLAFVAAERGVSIEQMETSTSAAFGLTQARPSLYLAHCGLEVQFGKTPTVLLHGTQAYRSMSRAERSAGIREIQRKLGMKKVDGLIGPSTLEAIEEKVGRRAFDKVAKYLLVKKYYGNHVKLVTSKERDKVFQRICRAERRDPVRTKYFLPDLWNPVHALAYTSVHLEDDLRIAKRSSKREDSAVDVAIAAYYCGIKSALNRNPDGLWYQRQVKAKAGKFKTVFA